MMKSHNALKQHKQILAGMEGFLVYSGNDDRFAAVQNLHVCKARIMLLPERVRRANPLFVMLTDSTQATNACRYREFHDWVTHTLT